MRQFVAATTMTIYILVYNRHKPDQKKRRIIQCTTDINREDRKNNYKSTVAFWPLLSPMSAAQCGWHQIVCEDKVSWTKKVPRLIISNMSFVIQRWLINEVKKSRTRGVKKRDIEPCGPNLREQAPDLGKCAPASPDIPNPPAEDVRGDRTVTPRILRDRWLLSRWTERVIHATSLIFDLRDEIVALLKLQVDEVNCLLQNNALTPALSLQSRH